MSTVRVNLEVSSLNNNTGRFEQYREGEVIASGVARMVDGRVTFDAAVKMRGDDTLSISWDPVPLVTP